MVLKAGDYVKGLSGSFYYVKCAAKDGGAARCYQIKRTREAHERRPPDESALTAPEVTGPLLGKELLQAKRLLAKLALQGRVTL